jgi:putative transposase
VLVTYVFRVRPTAAQYARLDEILRDQRHLYNAALQERQEGWRRGISISQNDQTKSLTEIRAFDEVYGSLPYNLSKWTLCRLEDAMRGFFRRVKRGARSGFPRFRGAGRWRSFGFSQKDGLRLVGSTLRFSGGLVGGLKIKMHRPLPEGAQIKSAVFTKQSGRWRAALAIDIAVASRHELPGTATGMDVGIEAIATLSDGSRFANLRAGTHRKAALRRASRALGRCKRGSRRRLKARARLARLQRLVRQARTNHLHQVSSVIARDYELIVVEALKLRNMTRSASGTVDAPGSNVRQKAGLNRALADAAPGRLIEMLRYKAERAGGVMIAVDPKRTSQECSSCGEIVKKALSERRHVCACGANLHRDHNAAINILARGLAAHGAVRGPGDANVGQQSVRRLGTAEPLAA